LAVGTPAPDFALSSVAGETVTLPGLLAPGRSLLVLFMSPTCGPCNALLPDLRHWQREHTAVLSIAVLVRGDEAANRAKAIKHQLHSVLFDPDAEVARAYRAMPTPSAVLVGADGQVRSPVAAGADGIRGLVVRVLDARGAVVGRRAEQSAASVQDAALSRDNGALQRPLHGGTVDGRAV
jgi:peroxiredoxin